MNELVCTTCQHPITADDRWCPQCRQPAVLLKRFWLQRDKLGQGGFGIVYEARDLRLKPGRRAVKELARTAGDDQQTRNEVESLIALSNGGLPFVPKIYDFDDQDPARFYIIMEYISGPTLDKIPRTYWTATNVAAFLDTLLTHLAQLHEAGLFHRDIKPQNIKYTNDGRFVLLDFGISKKTTDQSTLRALSIDYAPIEQLRHEGTDARSDLFSLGVTAYQLLTGKLPPNADERQKGKALPPPGELTPHIPQAFEQTILALLALDRAARPINANAARALLAPPEDSIKDELDRQFAPLEGTASPTVHHSTNTYKPELLRVGKGRILGMTVAAQTQTLAITTPLGTYLYDTDTFAERRLIGSDAPVQAPLFVQQGEYMLIALARSMSMWRARASDHQRSLTPAPAGTSLIALTDDQRLIAAAQADSVTLYDPAHPVQRQVFGIAGERPHALTFSPDGTHLALAAGRTCYLWRTSTFELVLTTELDTRISALTFTPDSQVLTIGFGTTVQSWRTSDGRPVLPSRSFGGRVTALAWAADGQIIAIAAGPMVVVTRLAQGEDIQAIATAVPTQYLAFLNDGRTLLGGSADDVRLWQVATGAVVHTLTAHWNRLHALTIAADGSRLAAIGGIVRCWQLADQRLSELRTYAYHTAHQPAITFTNDAQLLACASSAGVTLHHVPDLQVVYAIDTQPVQAHGLTIPVDQAHLVVVSAQFELHQLSDGSLLRNLPFPTDDVYDVSLVRNSATAAILSETAVYRMATNDGALVSTLDLAALDLPQGIGTAKSVSLAPDGTAVALLYSEHVGFWDFNPLRLRALLTASAERVVWAPDQQWCLLLQERVIRLYSIHEASLVLEQVFEGHNDLVSDAVWSPDLATIFSTSHDGTLRVWQRSRRSP